MYNLFKGIASFLLLLLFFSSCIPLKKTTYLQDKSSTGYEKEFKAPVSEGYEIRANDNLYIKVLSLDKKTYSFFNTESNPNANLNNVSLYINSYAVSDSGYIDIPFAGKIFVKGLTIEESKEKIQNSVNEYLKQTTIIVKLVNYYITVLGEVRKPGRYLIQNEKMNILEVLGLAGDIGDFGNRNKVSLIRKTSTGTIIKHLDITDKMLLETDYFYLLPNDVVYVEPLKAKVFGIKSIPFGTILSSITTLLLVLQFNK